MREYRERIKNEEPVETSGEDLDTGKTEKFMLLATEYYGGLDDMVIGGSGGDQRFEQSVEQEYQAYITAPLSAISVNILRFWEVGDLFVGISVLLMGRHRLAERPTPLFSRWRWIIYQSKRLPSLVNASFRQALKQIPSEGIASMLS